MIEPYQVIQTLLEKVTELGFEEEETPAEGGDGAGASPEQTFSWQVIFIVFFSAKQVTMVLLNSCMPASLTVAYLPACLTD